MRGTIVPLQIGALLTSNIMANFFTRLFGSKNARELRRMQKIVAQARIAIESYEKTFALLSFLRTSSLSEHFIACGAVLSHGGRYGTVMNPVHLSPQRLHALSHTVPF